MRSLFLASVFITATLFSGRVAAQSPTAEDLHKDLLAQKEEIEKLKTEYEALKKSQSQMKEGTSAAEKQAEKTRNDLEKVRAQLEDKLTPKTGWFGKLEALYFFDGEAAVDPAFGELGSAPGPSPSSNSISSDAPTVDGKGLRLSAGKFLADRWFYGAGFETHLITGGESKGQVSTDADNVHANLVNRNLADNNTLNGSFDDGVVDYARDRIDLDDYCVDLVVGRRMYFREGFSGFWKAGLRGAYSEMDRDVDYVNFETSPSDNTDWARIDFDSEMYGAGPLIGAGASLDLGKGYVLSGEASVAAVYSQFDLERDEVNYNQTLNRRAYMDIKTDTSALVPMLGLSVEVSKAWKDNLSFALGYSLSAWKDGSRQINIHGWDDIDEDTSPYTIDSEDIILHGLYLSACYRF